MRNIRTLAILTACTLLIIGCGVNKSIRIADGETVNGSKATVEATGNYSPTTFNMVAQISTTYAGVALSGQATTTAKRISEACPATPDAG